MNPTAKEVFHQAIAWVTQEITKEILTQSSGEPVSFNFESSTDNTIPSIDDQRRAIKALVNCGAIKIAKNIYPYPSYVISAMAVMGDLTPSGYVLEILQPIFDKISGQPHLIHELIKENASAPPLEAPPPTVGNQAVSTVSWPQGFKWKDNDIFDLDGKGEIIFSSKEDNKTKTYFEKMADKKDWVKVVDMAKLTGENASQVRTKLNQIRAKIRNNSLSHLVAVESKRDYSAGAYRLHPYPKQNV